MTCNLRKLEKQRLDDKYSIRLEMRQTRHFEQEYFELFLLDEHRCKSTPYALGGLCSAGRASQGVSGWIDANYFEQLSFPDSPSLSLPDAGLDERLFQLVGETVPPGGSFMVAYTMSHRASVVLLFLADCGMGFKDWYFAEGGREGPEKLQGFKAPSDAYARAKAEAMLQELRVFLTETAQVASGIEELARRRAELVIEALCSRYGLR